MKKRRLDIVGILSDCVDVRVVVRQPMLTDRNGSKRTGTGKLPHAGFYACPMHNILCLVDGGAMEQREGADGAQSRPQGQLYLSAGNGKRVRIRRRQVVVCAVGRVFNAVMVAAGRDRN